MTRERTFALHWRSGTIAEEVRSSNPHTVPAIRLLEFTEGEAAGTVSARSVTSPTTRGSSAAR